MPVDHKYFFSTFNDTIIKNRFWGFLSKKGSIFFRLKLGQKCFVRFKIKTAKSGHENDLSLAVLLALN